MTDISQGFYLQDGGKQSTGIDMEQNDVTVTLSILHGRSSPGCRSLTGGRRPRSPGSRVFPASRCVGRKSRRSESRAVRCALRPAATGSRDHGNTRRRLATERRSTSFHT